MKCQNYSLCIILILADNYMFKVKNKNTRTRCELCSKLTIKTQERSKVKAEPAKAAHPCFWKSLYLETEGQHHYAAKSEDYCSLHSSFHPT